MVTAQLYLYLLSVGAKLLYEPKLCAFVLYLQHLYS